MHTRVLRASLLLTGLALMSIGAGPPTAKVKAKETSYADLARFIRGQKGKVVVVDFWADF